ncbi:hypothetical protein HYFRA_00009346 [Hymenoscyphus fraxineus]|uniref:Ubiquitin-like domain-containing protein n=1 Tax=Hymenoscyphus fraxineus TaxID=746836 RepID=A0A9N9KZ61_9HELO|nr:hypothetical protein HYFRA_00009346 [Hymenoscyphus fraxineus]
MSFGFSAGDFITGANLCYQLFDALSGTQCPFEAYREALSEIGNLQCMLTRVRHMFENANLPDETINSASHIVLSSVKLIEKFLERTKKLQRRLSSDRGVSNLSNGWQKVGWSLFGEDELKSLRDQLQWKLSSITLLLATAQWQTFDKHRAFINKYQDPNPINGVKSFSADPGPVTEASDARKTEKSSTDEEKSTADIQTGLVTPSKNISPKQPIRFKDAVGRKLTFPFHLCSTWAGIEELIKEAFLHVEIIGPHVNEGHYDLISPSGEIILPRAWETTIQEGWDITMHMWPIPESQKAHGNPSANGHRHGPVPSDGNRRAQKRPGPPSPHPPPPRKNNWFSPPPDIKVRSSDEGERSNKKKRPTKHSLLSAFLGVGAPPKTPKKPKTVPWPKPWPPPASVLTVSDSDDHRGRARGRDKVSDSDRDSIISSCSSWGSSDSDRSIYESCESGSEST